MLARPSCPNRHRRRRRSPGAARRPRRSHRPPRPSSSSRRSRSSRLRRSRRSRQRRPRPRQLRHCRRQARRRACCHRRSRRDARRPRRCGRGRGGSWTGHLGTGLRLRFGRRLSLRSTIGASCTRRRIAPPRYNPSRASSSATSESIGTRTCSVVSRSRMVTARVLERVEVDGDARAACRSRPDGGSADRSTACRRSRTSSAAAAGRAPRGPAASACPSSTAAAPPPCTAPARVQPQHGAGLAADLVLVVGREEERHHRAGRAGRRLDHVGHVALVRRPGRSTRAARPSAWRAA